MYMFCNTPIKNYKLNNTSSLDSRNDHRFSGYRKTDCVPNVAPNFFFVENVSVDRSLIHVVAVNFDYILLYTTM